MTNSPDRRIKLLEMIQEARGNLSYELAKANKGEEAVDGLQQLLFIDRKLEELAEILGAENWREHPRPKPGMARLVIDTWPLKDPLGNLITEIEYAYGRLK
jgi:hypothetical protein